MSAGKLSVNACVNVAEHAHYKKEMFPKPDGSDVSRVLSQAKKKKKKKLLQVLTWQLRILWYASMRHLKFHS